MRCVLHPQLGLRHRESAKNCKENSPKHGSSLHFAELHGGKLYRGFERRYYRFFLLPKVTSKSARKMMTNNYLRPACADGDTDTQKSYQSANRSALWGLDHASAHPERASRIW
jgi:hypothetical protein